MAESFEHLAKFRKKKKTKKKNKQRHFGDQVID